MYCLVDRKSNNKIYVCFLANLIINISNNVETKNILKEYCFVKSCFVLPLDSLYQGNQMDHR